MIPPATPQEDADKSRIVKCSVTLAGHRTSLSLEGIFWDLLVDIAHSSRRSINSLVAEIDAKRTGNLSSAVRLYVLNHVLTQKQADNE